MDKNNIKLDILTILTSAVFATLIHELLNNSDFRVMIYELILVVLRNYPIYYY